MIIMIYVILFEDNEEFSDRRAKYMEQHLAFLRAHANNIISAGPLLEENTQQGAGGLWLVEGQDVETIQSLITTDPFWNTGLRKSYQILQWKQVFSEGKVRI